VSGFIRVRRLLFVEDDAMWSVYEWRRGGWKLLLRGLRVWRC